MKKPRLRYETKLYLLYFARPITSLVLWVVGLGLAAKWYGWHLVVVLFIVAAANNFQRNEPQ